VKRADSLILLLAGCAAASLADAGGIDLSHWKLTLPESDGSSAEPKELTPEELRGYSSEWFYLAADGGIVFRAPVGGAHTAHSHYARTELREQLVPGNNIVNWTSTDNATLIARIKVIEVPEASGQVIVGQIHGKDATPLLKLSYSQPPGKASGELYGKFVVAPKEEGDEGSETNEKCVLKKGLRLGEEFSYTIHVGD
jgi:hypothetical protein